MKLVLQRIAFWLFVVGSVSWMIWISMPTEEDKIHARVGDLLRLLDTLPGDSTLKRVAQVERAMEYFTKDVAIRLDGALNLEDVQGRDQLMEAVRGAIISVNRLRIERYDTRTTVEPAKMKGTVTMTVFVYVDDLLNPHIQLMRVGFSKEKGVWRISAAETVSPVK